jgi:hypothetical protein
MLHISGFYTFYAHIPINNKEKLANPPDLAHECFKKGTAFTFNFNKERKFYVLNLKEK